MIEAVTYRRATSDVSLLKLRPTCSAGSELAVCHGMVGAEESEHRRLKPVGAGRVHSACKCARETTTTAPQDRAISSLPGGDDTSKILVNLRIEQGDARSNVAARPGDLYSKTFRRELRREISPCE